MVRNPKTDRIGEGFLTQVLSYPYSGRVRHDPDITLLHSKTTLYATFRTDVITFNALFQQETTIAKFDVLDPGTQITIIVLYSNNINHHNVDMQNAIGKSISTTLLSAQGYNICGGNKPISEVEKPTPSDLLYGVRYPLPLDPHGLTPEELDPNTQRASRQHPATKLKQYTKEQLEARDFNLEMAN
jgi:hypothetical protein